MKSFILVVLFSSFVFAQDKLIPQIVLDAIRNAECLKEGGICNPNFIRINKKKDVLTAKENNIKMNGYILKCKNAKTCSNYVEKLLQLGIKNIDLGPYQTNYYWQNDRWADAKDYTGYFVHEEAEARARTILRDLISQYGYSWRTLGRYHHFDPKNKSRNRAYYSKLYKYINGVTPKMFNKEI